MYLNYIFIVFTFLMIFLYTLYSFVLSIPFSSRNNILTNCTIHCTTLHDIRFIPFRTAFAKKALCISTQCLVLSVISLEDPSNCQYLLVIGVRYNNTGLGGRCMNDLTVSDIQCHMSGVADQVSGLCIGQSVNCCALAAVCG